MKVLVEDKDIQIIKIDSEDFLRENDFFINGFKEISNSNNLMETFNPEKFFLTHHEYSIICATKDSKMIAYMYGTRLNEYFQYKDIPPSDWHIGYIKTHFNYQNQRIGTRLLLVGILDMIKQGAKKIHYMPNEQSNHLFEEMVSKRNCLEIEEGHFGRKVLIKK